MSMYFEKDQQALKKQVEARAYSMEGDLVLSPYVICKTCAYYIGQWCAEYLDYGNGLQWVYQPYDRATDYMSTLEEAQSMLKTFDQELSGANLDNGV